MAGTLELNLDPHEWAKGVSERLLWSYADLMLAAAVLHNIKLYRPEAITEDSLRRAITLVRFLVDSAEHALDHGMSLPLKEEE